MKSYQRTKYLYNIKDKYIMLHISKEVILEKNLGASAKENLPIQHPMNANINSRKKA